MNNFGTFCAPKNTSKHLYIIVNPNVLYFYLLSVQIFGLPGLNVLGIEHFSGHSRLLFDRAKLDLTKNWSHVNCQTSLWPIILWRHHSLCTRRSKFISGSTKIHMYGVRNLEKRIRFSLKSWPSERFHRPEMFQIKAKISLCTNAKLIFHKNVGWQGY